jgi:hypothetical protein
MAKLKIIAMPTLSIFYGIKITMYPEKGEKHHLPHFHAKYGGYEASISISDCQILDGFIPTNAYKLVKQWVKKYKVNLEEDWELFIKGKPLKKITPLDDKKASFLPNVDNIKLKKVTPLTDFKLDLVFTDGFSGILDLKKADFFPEKLQNPKYFAQGRCRGQVAAWPGPKAVELGPTSLYILLAQQKGELNKVKCGSQWTRNWVEELLNYKES